MTEPNLNFSRAEYGERALKLEPDLSVGSSAPCSSCNAFLTVMTVFRSAIRAMRVMRHDPYHQYQLRRKPQIHKSKSR